MNELNASREDLFALEQILRRVYDAVASGSVKLSAVEEVVEPLLETEVAEAPVKSHVLADGEVFKVTHDFGNSPEPEKMPNRFGYSGDWPFDGTQLTGKQTREFKWVAVGRQKDLDAVRAALAEHGDVPEGQWLEAIREQFEPESWRGIADSSWLDPGVGRRGFPCLHPDGDPDFRWAGRERGADWRWLVEVK